MWREHCALRPDGQGRSPLGGDVGASPLRPHAPASREGHFRAARGPVQSGVEDGARLGLRTRAPGWARARGQPGAVGVHRRAGLPGPP